MKDEIADKLLALNRSFYEQFADPFADSRRSPQPGFSHLLEKFPLSLGRVLDVGCGNGRFGLFLQEQDYDFEYVGIDFSSKLLAKAEKSLRGTFYQRDINQPGLLEYLGAFDVIACLATMQHIPGIRNRVRLLSDFTDHLSKRGTVILANWQFLDSSRQRRKIRDWQEVGIDGSEVEANDYLLSWQRDGFGLRYVCMIDAQETVQIAEEAGLSIRGQFRSDGREGNLNLYTVLTKT